MGNTKKIMAETTDKMQTRADLTAILSNYINTKEISATMLKNHIKEIKKMKNQEYIAKLLFKELASSNQQYVNAVAVISLEAVSNENFEKYALEALRDKSLSDDKKFLIISLVKQKGLDIQFEDMKGYMSNPEKMAQDGIEEFLKSIKNDPEAQIDLLDFYQNIPDDERVYLLNSLVNDFEGDNLANALSLIIKLDVQGEEFEIITKKLIEIDSSYAKEGLGYILEKYDLDKKLEAKVSNALNLLKQKYKDFKNESIITNSSYHKCYISFVDGLSNFSLVVSRKNDDEIINCALMTVNLNLGLTSCMGFGGIKQDYFEMIIRRLFEDSIPVEIEPNVLKSILEFYVNKNETTNTSIPYEYIVWKNLLNDVEVIGKDLSEYLNSKLGTININSAKVRKMANAKIYESWYYNKEQNELISEFIDSIEEKHPTDIEEINNMVSSFINEKLLKSVEFMNEFISRLLIQAYVAYLAGLKVTSSCAYSLCFKNPHLIMFLNSIIDKSIYGYFAEVIADEDNKFKEKIKSNYTKEEIPPLMKALEKKWV